MNTKGGYGTMSGPDVDLGVSYESFGILDVHVLYYISK